MQQAVNPLTDYFYKLVSHTLHISNDLPEVKIRKSWSSYIPASNPTIKKTVDALLLALQNLPDTHIVYKKQSKTNTWF